MTLYDLTCLQSNRVRRRPRGLKRDVSHLWPDAVALPGHGTPIPAGSGVHQNLLPHAFDTTSFPCPIARRSCIYSVFCSLGGSNSSFGGTTRYSRGSTRGPKPSCPSAFLPARHARRNSSSASGRCLVFSVFSFCSFGCQTEISLFGELSYPFPPLTSL